MAESQGRPGLSLVLFTWASGRGSWLLLVAREAARGGATCSSRTPRPRAVVAIPVAHSCLRLPVSLAGGRQGVLYRIRVKETLLFKMAKSVSRWACFELARFRFGGNQGEPALPLKPLVRLSWRHAGSTTR